MAPSSYADTSFEPAAAATFPPPAKLPVAGLLAFAMTGFIAIMTETLPAGLLPQISHGLAISEASAGQLVSVYALGSLLAAIPLTVVTQGWRRRPVLLAAVVGFLLFNALTTVASTFAMALFARFMAGVAAGLAWGLLAGYARRLVPTSLQGRALAIAMVGTPLALSLGTPAGTWLGGLLGWRVAFGTMSALALLLIPWIWLAVRDMPGKPDGRRFSVIEVLRLRGVWPVLSVIMIWMWGHNVLYTYIAPYLWVHGMSNTVDIALLIFGLTALAGIAVIGITVDRWLRGLTMISLAGFAVAAELLVYAGDSRLLVYAGIGLWGLCFGGAATLLQTAAADAAGPHVDVVQAMVTTAWNLAIAGGGLSGGMVLQRFGSGAEPCSMALLSLAALVLVSVATSGFRPGPRAS